VSFPFLLSVYNDFMKEIIDKNVLVEILKTIQSYVWRRFILGLPTNALNKIFMTLYGEINKNDYLTSLRRVLVKKTGAQRFPNDKEIKTVLKEKDVYNIQSKNKTYFLELLENHNNREHVPIFDNDKITIEHIFPRNPDPKWKEELDEREFNLLKENYLHTIGNLTLSGNNGSLSNKTFIEKQNMNNNGEEQGYKFSRLWLNKYLKDINEWNLLELNRRYEIILTRFISIWKFPEVDIIFEDTENEVNIFEAASPKNRKLEYFIFREERVVTEYISQMYFHVNKILFEENPSLFLITDLKDYLPVTNNPNEVRDALELSDNYFIERNLDSNGKFRRIKRVLEVFELQDELIIKYDN
jgi:hypothetical protein